MNKKLLSLTIQLLAIFFLFKYFVIDNTSEKKFILFESSSLIYLVVFLISLKLFIGYIFFIILNTISNRKNDLADVSTIFLFGGMINQLLPGAGHAYKYYKLKSSSKILLSQFLVSQTIFTLNSLLSLIFLALLTGIILVAKFNFNYLILIFFSLIIVLIYFYKNYKNFFKKKLINIKKLEDILNQLKIIKDIIKAKYLKFIFIHLGFVFMVMLESVSFFIALKLFGAEITLIKASYIYIITALTKTVLLINYFGIFELILLSVSTIIIPGVEDILILGISFTVINTFSLILAAITMPSIRFIKKKIS
ncbi:hypothetical protein ACIJYG_05405 [Candidatus Pelagibacter bacterium nBUS_27]|uniref:hypothetical protein n=1 Tax=Candidatus Pelagibacter bacterium nBUS_27 TaxID=3374188 RepID=UPI003EB8C9BE